ncbi:hypothetical protein Xind_02720 [Xenorhabdus indica]|nr:hypothetical protein [Xenorhabdus indica]
MKVLQKSNWSEYWCKVTIIFLSLSIWPGICDSNPYTIFELKPLNVTESGQSANFELSLGHYSATITNLDSIIEFKGIMTVVWFTSRDPKI